MHFRFRIAWDPKGGFVWGVQAFHTKGLCMGDPDSFRIWIWPIPNVMFFFDWWWIAKERDRRSQVGKVGHR